MAEDDAPLVEALLTIIDAARAYLPPDRTGKDEFSTKVSKRSTIRRSSRRLMDLKAILDHGFNSKP
jgi:hypothetical protein